MIAAVNYSGVVAAAQTLVVARLLLIADQNCHSYRYDEFLPNHLE